MSLSDFAQFFYALRASLNFNGSSRNRVGEVRV
jgi:hypothetical protein